MAVFTTHAAYWAGAYIGHGVWGSVLARLDVGVAIFFVLSGFLLARPYLARALDRRPAPAVGHYYWKRALRILPLYVVTALLALGLITKNNDLGPRDWLVTLGFGNTFVDHQLPDGLTHMWSLAVEVSFYVFLPLLMLIAVGRGGRLHPRRVVVLVLVMVSVTVGWLLWGSPWASGWTTGQPNEWLPAYLGWFGVGIMLALVELLHRAAARRAGSRASCPSRDSPAAAGRWPPDCCSSPPRPWPDRRCWWHRRPGSCWPRTSSTPPSAASW